MDPKWHDTIIRHNRSIYSAILTTLATPAGLPAQPAHIAVIRMWEFSRCNAFGSVGFQISYAWMEPQAWYVTYY